MSSIKKIISNFNTSFPKRNLVYLVCQRLPPKNVIQIEMEDTKMALQILSLSLLDLRSIHKNYMYCYTVTIVNVKEKHN